jgi:hypothetical protein
MNVLVQDLDGDIPMQNFVIGAIDSAHPARSDLRVNAIVPKPLPNHSAVLLPMRAVRPPNSRTGVVQFAAEAGAS